MDSLDHLAFEAHQPLGQSEQQNNMNAQQALHLRAELLYDLLQAEAQLRNDPDGAALRLDGALRRIAAGWFAMRGLVNPPDGELFRRIDALSPAIGGRLRLALHAPNVAARLVHCRALLRAALAEAGENASDDDPHTSARQLPSDHLPNHLVDNRSVQHASIR